MGNMATENAAGNRIEQLLDAGSFVEIGGAVTARTTDFNMQEKKTPADGVITGYGVIDGNLVYVYSQDASVLKGSIGEMHARKIANIYDMAMKMGAPVIGLIDCAGLRLQEATDALNAFGSFYYKQAMASGVIPQITAVFGNCGGGLAAAAALSDFTFMAENGKLFVNSPNTIPGNTADKCDTASAKFQSEESGIVDGVGSEEEILGEIRSLAAILPANNEDNDAYDECTDDLNRVCADLENAAEDAALALSMISDNGVFIETKKAYAKDMVTGFIKLNGITVGAVANATVMHDENGNRTEEFEAALTAQGCEKAADFIQYCDAFDIPVLSMTNTTGFKATSCSEKRLPKALARMTYAFANATTAKINFITGDAFGSSYVMMNSKSLGADLVYAWPDAKVGMMDAKSAAKIMYADASADVLDEKAKEYEALQSNVENAARRGYIDLIINPADTRKYLIAGFEMLFTKKVEGPMKKHGAK